ncbi:hypothetical protein EXS71_02595 [Candidatus Uhrbacteria bacterium]|nr:hypothetical protein [Candidatus Uhrbacteria bacterium]
MMHQEKKIKLLVTIQAVDLDDPLHGFFHEWLEHAAKDFSSILVLALRTGRYALPKNVEVVPLRPKGSRSRWQVVKTLWSISVTRRQEYDVVFVRGDPQYVLVGAWLWRCLGKRIIFWYAHYRTTWPMVIAAWFSHVVTSSVPEACSTHWVRSIQFLGQGIAQDRFAPSTEPRDSAVKLGMIVFGRVSKAKRIDEIIEDFLASQIFHRAELFFIGPAIDRVYVDRIRQLLVSHPEMHWDQEGVSYDQVPRILQSYDVMLNAYEASLDKSIIEGMMSGLIVIMATNGLRAVLPPTLHWLIARDHGSRISAIRRVASMGAEERASLGHVLREIAVSHHSLDSQIKKLKALC